MGGNTGMMIGMAALGAVMPAAIGAMGTATGMLVPAAGGGLTAATTGSAVGGAMASMANASVLTSAMTMGGLGMAMGASQPQMPDFSSNFAEQQALLTRQNSFGRLSTAELEGVLETGSDFDKNNAFDELRRRGEDEARLLEISGRADRTAERQAELDQFLEESAPPSSDELELLANQFAEARLASFERDLDDERTRLKQISAARGTLDSNRNRELNLRLAEAAAANRGDIRNASLNSAIGFQRGIQDIRDQGFNRLIRGSSFAEEQDRFNISLANAERGYQERLRQARTADQRNLAFQRLQSEINGGLARFQQQSADSRNNALLGLGVTGLALDRNSILNNPVMGPSTKKKDDDASSIFTPMQEFNRWTTVPGMTEKV